MKKNKLSNIEPAEELLESGNEINTVYGDLVTFIMMLFILLFVLSYNENKREDFLTRIQERMSGKQEGKKKSLTTDHLLVSQLQRFIKKQKLQKYSQVLVDEQKVTLILNSPTLFKSGSAVLNARSKVVITELSELLKGVDNPIMIEGHTDNVPIHTAKYDSNWELSFDRAYSILKLMIHRLNHTPETLSAIGYGEYRPVASNDTDHGRALNRRIEVNVIRILEK